MSHRAEYWTRGQGANDFLTWVANTISKSYVADQKFTVELTDDVLTALLVRVRNYPHLDDYELATIMKIYADEVGTSLLANWTQRWRWHNLESPGMMPTPLNLPTYVSRGTERSGEFLPNIGRTSNGVAAMQLARILEETRRYR
jgi:hypothetical protein